MNYDELLNFNKTNPQHYRFVLGGRTANAIEKLKIISLSKWHNPKTPTAYIIIYINDYYQLRSDDFCESKYFLELPFNKRIPYTKEMKEYIIKESEKIDKEKKSKMKAKNFRTGEIKEIDNLTYCNDMDRIVECPECGKKVRYGNLYNVGEWFEPKGVWRFGICEECAEKEWERIRKESKR